MEKQKNILINSKSLLNLLAIPVGIFCIVFATNFLNSGFNKNANLGRNTKFDQNTNKTYQFKQKKTNTQQFLKNQSSLKEKDRSASFTRFENNVSSNFTNKAEDNLLVLPNEKNTEFKNNESRVVSFSIMAVGDINCGGTVGKYISNYGEDYPYKNVKDIISAADVTMGNLECALSSRGKPIEGKKFTFCGLPSNAGALRNAGFDVLSVANNHAKDFGPVAFVDTIANLKQKEIVFIGGGKDSEEAYTPKTLSVNNRKIAFFALCDVLPSGFSATASLPGVASARDKSKINKILSSLSNSDSFIVVSMHWGKELSAYPSSNQIKLAHYLIDNGVDLVIGHHPHVIQGIEIYKDKLVAYSLGNFVFSPGNNLGRQSIILTVEVEQGKIRQAKVYPVYIEGVAPKILTGKKAETWLSEVSRRIQFFGVKPQIDRSKQPSLMINLQ